MNDGVKIPVSAEFDSRDSDRALSDFARKFNAVGEQIARARRMKFEPIDKGQLELLQKTKEGWEDFLRRFPAVRKRMAETGQKGADFLDVDFDKMYMKPGFARDRAFTSIFGGDRFSPLARADHPHEVERRSRRVSMREQERAREKERPSQLARIAGAGARAAGPVGGVVADATSQGMQFGVGAGIAGLIGGLAALGIGKVIGGVREKIGAAQNELIGYDTLKRTLGDVNVGFEQLKDSLRDSTRGLGMTYDESLRLGQQFTKLSGVYGEEGAKGLAAEVRTGAGFARSFGNDPSQWVSFMGQQRLYGGTRNHDDSVRLGLMIGEGIARAGVFSKVDEVLDAIGSYTAQQTRLGMNTANVPGYTSFLTGMMQTGIPGTDPASSALMLSRVNAAIAGGGGAGEASENFLFRAIGTRMGLNPLQTLYMREQGAFGTGAGAFGPGSIYARYSQLYGGGAPGAAGSQATNLSMIMDLFEKRYAGRPDEMANAIARTMNLSMGQAMTLAVANKQFGNNTLGALGGRLQRLGINLGSINETGLSSMAQIEASGKTSEEKDAEIRKAAEQGQMRTEGEETRRTIAGVSNAVQSAATLLVGPLNTIRDSVLYIAGQGRLSQREVSLAVAGANYRDSVSEVHRDLDPGIAAAEKERDRLGLERRVAVTNRLPTLSREKRAELDKQIADLEQQELEADKRVTTLKSQLADQLEERKRAHDAQVNQINGTPSGQLDKVGGAKGTTAYDSLFAEAGRAYNIDPALLKTIAFKESSLNPNAVGLNANGSADLGLMQHNSRYLKERGITNWRDPRQSIMAGAKFLRQKIDQSGGNIREAVRRYNGAGEKAEQYSDEIMSDLYGNTPVPKASAGASGDTKVQVEVSGSFNLHGANGQPVAAPITINKRVAPATPAGVRMGAN